MALTTMPVRLFSCILVCVCRGNSDTSDFDTDSQQIALAWMLDLRKSKTPYAARLLTPKGVSADEDRERSFPGRATRIERLDGDVDLAVR